MSYIINTTSPFVSVKLTEKGREMLAQGQLNFSFWGIGDSEINYNREELVDAAIIAGSSTPLTGSTRIMRPVDRQPNIKSFITPYGATSPYQTLPSSSSSINVIKAIVNNEAKERGFFTSTGNTYSTLTGDTYASTATTFSNVTLTGGTQIEILYGDKLSVGDIILIKLKNNSLVSDINDYSNTEPIPHLWFKVQSINGNTITVDRNTPNMSGEVTYNSVVIVYRGGEVYETIATGNTTSYWDSGTLSFDSSTNITCDDVPVWNMNNVWCESLAGITGLTTTNLYEDYTKFGSYQYLGAKNPYFEYLCESTATTVEISCGGPGLSSSDSISKSISIIHYTNNAISNLYGEFLYVDATNDKIVSIFLPDLMYHRRDYSTGSGTTMGMRFIASGSTKLIGTSDIEYIDLKEDLSLISSAGTAQVIGRVYPQLKTIVIHDDEIVAALSYKSNRNWTLPRLNASLVSPSGGTSTGILGVSKTIYLTYSLENIASTGLTSSLPCQSYIKLTNETNSNKDVSFRIEETDLLPYMRKKETSLDGYGFYANTFKLLYQIVSDTNERPDPSAWKEYDFTSTAITGGAGETITPSLLEGQNPMATGFILDVLKDVSATTFNLISLLNMPPNISPEDLQFGDERFFYGNIETYIGATIYKTIFGITVNSSFFNATTNPTRSTDSSTNPPNIKLSEVGVYDSNKNLVCIGKLSKPIALAAGNQIMLELSIDF